MYSTCLFCKSHLGSNEAIEHFAVGRRLAYDERRGRLWVICRRCERWNLTPLESRWEAIEEAERLFREARLRIATDNIALAHLKEGTELVRIGKPPRLELAGWRYGDQFGRRRRKRFLLTGLGLALPAVPFLVPSSLAVGLVYAGGVGTYVALDARKMWVDRRVPTLFLRDADNGLLPLTKLDTWTATLVPAGSRDWRLTVRHREHPAALDAGTHHLNSPSPLALWRRALELTRLSGRRMPQAPKAAEFTGAAAQDALSMLLPYANEYGASARRIREAVGVLELSSSVDQLAHQAATTKQSSSRAGTGVAGAALTRLPAEVRLAMEMVLHDEDERRAMEGELAMLERRWREAEEIASIADSLLTPVGTESRIDSLRETKEG